MKGVYDYIIAGAGSSGCVLANRLSADPSHSVLLLESGPADDSMFVHMPRGLGVINNPGSKYIWEYDVETGEGMPSERWFRGRTLGGSSSTNGMIYMRGAPGADAMAHCRKVSAFGRQQLIKFVASMGNPIRRRRQASGVGAGRFRTTLPRACNGPWRPALRAPITRHPCVSMAEMDKHQWS